MPQPGAVPLNPSSTAPDPYSCRPTLNDLPPPMPAVLKPSWA